MSDRIKKIKIKQVDSSFSDYIPIGADAKDIDFEHSGASVEDKLREKILNGLSSNVIIKILVITLY